MGIADWPQDIPRYVPCEMYPKDTTEEQARKLFKEKHNKEPLKTFIWSDWRYAGPINDK